MEQRSGPVVICVAPNGARRGKADHPALPTTPEELAEDAARCAAAGASVIHLHVRDPAGAHSLDPGRYRAAIAAIAARVGDALLIQVTTEAVGRYAPAEMAATVRALRPAAASVALRELAPDETALADAARFYAWAADAGVAIQHILYAPAELARLVALVRRGVIAEAPNALFVLGRHAADGQSDPAALPGWLANWPGGWPWSVCAFGAAEARCLAAAIDLGGHVRVGFENNLLRADGTPARDNAENVAAIAAIVRRAGLAVAGRAEAGMVYGATSAA